MVVVEVRQRTLCVEGRSWTRRTRRTTRRRTTRRRRRRGGGDEEEMRRRGEEEQATDIKSNNPHLAGGEKWEKHHDTHGAGPSTIINING